jgi:hypothetical protein
VGQHMGEEIGAAYRRALAVESLSRELVALVQGMCQMRAGG